MQLHRGEIQQSCLYTSHLAFSYLTLNLTAYTVDMIPDSYSLSKTNKTLDTVESNFCSSKHKCHIEHLVNSDKNRTKSTKCKFFVSLDVKTFYHNL